MSRKVSTNMIKSGKSKSVKSFNDAENILEFSDSETEIEIEKPASLQDEADFNYNESKSTVLREFREFLLSNPEYINSTSDPSTNIVDRSSQVAKSGNGNKGASCFKIPDEKISKYFKYLEACRRTGVKTMMCEKQLEYSGMMLDFDIAQNHAESQINKFMCTKICSIISKYIIKYIDIENPLNTTLDDNQAYIPIHIAFTRKPAILFNEEKQCYRDGLHVLIPSIQVSRETKRFLFNKIKDDGVLQEIFADIQPAGGYTRDKFFDINSAHVMAFFLGSSTKINSPPYKLDEIFEVRLPVGNFSGKDGNSDADMNSIEIYPSSCKELFDTEIRKNIILVHELSLNWEKPHNKGGVIKKLRYNVRERHMREVLKFKSVGKESSVEDLFASEFTGEYGELSLLSTNDPNALFIKSIIDTLNPRRSREYLEWRQVVSVLAATSKSYKPLAEYFSKKCPEKFDKDAFEKLWEELINSKQKNCLTLGSLHYWAKMDNPERYNEVRTRSLFSIVYRKIYDPQNEGNLQHFDVAQILHEALKYKLVFDPNTNEWFEFITDIDPHSQGELYKWRRCATIPNSIKRYMSVQLCTLFRSVVEKIKDSIENSNEEMAGFHSFVKKNCIMTSKKLKDSGFKSSTARECEQLFEKIGFAESLDTDPMILGVGNGVVKLGKTSEFIQGFHGHLVSKFTPVNYIPFNPRDPTTKKLLFALRNLFLDREPDSFNFIMHYLASSLDGRKKESMFMIFIGGGSNGKSFLMELHKGAIGGMYAKKIPLSFITSKDKHGENATPILMSLKGARFSYFSESDKSEKANCRKVKELTGLETITGRDLYGGLSNFRQTSLLALTTNNLLEFDSSDDAIWRRIIIIPAKMKFCKKNTIGFEGSGSKDGDGEFKANEYEREADLSLARDWNENPEIQAIYLGILIHYYESLMRNYDGEVRNVPHPHIKFETVSYRNKQDHINNFIDMKIVKTLGGKDDQITMETLIDKYTSWYKAFNPEDRLVGKGIRESFENSKLSGIFVPTRAGKVIYGHRVLDNNELPNFDEGETYLTDSLHNTDGKSTVSFNIMPETANDYYERMCREVDERKAERKLAEENALAELEFKNIEKNIYYEEKDETIKSNPKTEEYIFDKTGLRTLPPIEKISKPDEKGTSSSVFNDAEIDDLLSDLDESENDESENNE